MTDLESYYNRKISKIDSDKTRITRLIARLEKKISMGGTAKQLVKWNSTIASYKHSLACKDIDKKTIEDGKVIMDSFGVQNHYKSYNDSGWIATLPEPKDSKAKKSYYCSFSSRNIDYYSKHLDEISKSGFITRDATIFYGKALQVKGFGKVYFDAKFVLKSGWVDDSTDPLLFFNMNNNSVREILVFLSTIKEKITGTSPYWIDNYVFLL